MEHLITTLVVVLLGLRARTARLRGERHSQSGLGTLEMVIITLGLMAVAALLVAAITAAVRNRISQIQ